MTAKDKATEIFNKHYAYLFEFGEDLSEEVLISFLAKRAALAEVSGILQANPTKRTIKGEIIDNTMYWVGVQQELNKL